MRFGRGRVGLTLGPKASSGEEVGAFHAEGKGNAVLPALERRQRQLVMGACLGNEGVVDVPTEAKLLGPAEDFGVA